jgi:hypothetical protein
MISLYTNRLRRAIAERRRDARADNRRDAATRRKSPRAVPWRTATATRAMNLP